MDQHILLDQFNKTNTDTLMETLGIVYTEIGKDYLIGKMEVTSKIHQPFGLLHGGASIALAETLGSMLSNHILEGDDQVAVGQHMDANHVKAKRDGTVFGHATVVKKGRSSHIIKIEIKDEKDQLICYCHLTNAVIPKNMSKKFQDQLDELIRLQHDFVLIRKPREDAIHLHWDESVDGAEQFVFRNFDNSVHECWKQKERLTMDMNQFNFSIPLVLQENTVDEGIHHADYLTMIDETVEELQSRSAIEKIVMSRIQEESHDGIDLSASLKALHRRYPKAYVYLWHSLNHGTWIGASPELLLRAKNLTIETVSLAGTKAKDRGWTSKEIHEQQVVTDYITSTLAVAKPLKVDGPHTVDAGFFEHLKSYISAEIETRDQVETFLNALHPTPAVCGLPKEEAKAFILEHEGYNRKFYAGFMGWSNDYESEYFVNLRWAQLFSNKVKLYVGGGIMADSAAENEWTETQMKAKTIGELLIYS